MTDLPKGWTKTKEERYKEDVNIEFVNFDGSKKIQVWKYAPLNWRATVNNNFLAKDVTKGEAMQEVLDYMKRFEDENIPSSSDYGSIKFGKISDCFLEENEFHNDNKIKELIKNKKIGIEGYDIWVHDGDKITEDILKKSKFLEEVNNNEN